MSTTLFLTRPLGPESHTHRFVPRPSEVNGHRVDSSVPSSTLLVSGSWRQVGTTGHPTTWCEDDGHQNVTSYPPHFPYKDWGSLIPAPLPFTPAKRARGNVHEKSVDPFQFLRRCPSVLETRTLLSWNLPNPGFGTRFPFICVP